MTQHLAAVTLSPMHHLIVAFLVLVFPLWDRRETRRLKTSTDPRVRVRSYQKTIAWQVVVTLILLVTMQSRLLFAPPAAAAALSLRMPGTMRSILIGVVVGLVIGALMPVLLARRSAAARQQQMNQLSKFAFFLPHTREERRWFAAMCVAVGVCEEIIFRGFLIRYLASLPFDIGIIAAVIVAALIFGLDHGYQGWTGMLLTAVLALLLTAAFFVTGALWVPMLIHALTDLRVLLFMPPAPEPVS